jgi:hypothetical protein
MKKNDDYFVDNNKMDPLNLIDSLKQKLNLKPDEYNFIDTEGCEFSSFDLIFYSEEVYFKKK